MLRVFQNTTPNGVNKDLRFAQSLIKKGLKFISGDTNVGLILYLLMVLLLVKEGGVFKENGGK